MGCQENMPKAHYSPKASAFTLALVIGALSGSARSIRSVGHGKTRETTLTSEWRRHKGEKPPKQPIAVQRLQELIEAPRRPPICEIRWFLVFSHAPGPQWTYLNTGAVISTRLCGNTEGALLRENRPFPPMHQKNPKWS